MILNKPLVRLTTVDYQCAVSMISFAQVLTAQWSNTIPSQNVWFQVRIDLTLFHFNNFKWSPKVLPFSNAFKVSKLINQQTDQLDTLTFFDYNKAFISTSVSVMAYRPSFNSHQTLLRLSHLPQLIAWRLKSRTASHLTNSVSSLPASGSTMVTLFPTTTSKKSPPSISSYAICVVAPRSLSRHD